VEPNDWRRAQQMMKTNAKKKIIDDNIPLRGVLRCQCQANLTGAASRGKGGRHYFYYKCNHGHLNVSATHAHNQLEQILSIMSLPDYLVDAIREDAQYLLEERLKESSRMLKQARTKLDQVESERYSV